MSKPVADGTSPRSYGIVERAESAGEVARLAERIRLAGYAVLPSGLAAAAVGDLGSRLEHVMVRQADWSEAEDLTAVVFLEAFRRRKHVVVVDGKLLPWLYGIATNVLRNRRRALWRHRHLVAQLTDESVKAVEPDAATRTEAAMQMRSVLTRIATLPRVQQDVIALCLWSGLSYEEAAVALDVPVGTIRSRLSRARAALTEPDGARGHKHVEVELERIVEK